MEARGDERLTLVRLDTGERIIESLAGHLVEGTISVTGEFWIRGAPVAVTRRPGDFPGLKLIRFDD